MYIYAQSERIYHDFPELCVGTKSRGVLLSFDPRSARGLLLLHWDLADSKITDTFGFGYK